MQYEWDERKSRTNKTKHGLLFDVVESFDWATAIVEVDDREDYGELREIAFGFIGAVLYCLIFTWLDDDTVRVISLRPANKREAKRYAQKSRQELG